MRYLLPALSCLLAVSASVIPVPPEYIDYITDRPSVLPGQIDASIAQAVYISQNLDTEIKQISATIANDPLLQLHPTQHDTPAELARAFAAAQAGIEALPTLTADDNLPQYVADHYGPLVAVLGDTLFLSLLDLRELSNAVLKNQLYDSIVGPADGGIYHFVLLLNDKFQGFGCALSKSMGQDTTAGQSLKVISEQLFYLMLDNIPQGQC